MYICMRDKYMQKNNTVTNRINYNNSNVTMSRNNIVVK